MNNTNEQRLYVQLQPDSASLEQILTVQSHFGSLGRIVKEEKIHLTIIHFGIVSEILENLPATTQVKRTAFSEYVARTQSIISTSPESYELQPKAIELYGEHSTTLAIRYEEAPQLVDIHENCLHALQEFLSSSGVVKVEEWMSNDRNFMYAQTLNPHVTIVKNFSGTTDIPANIRLKNARFTTMPLLY